MGQCLGCDIGYIFGCDNPDKTIVLAEYNPFVLDDERPNQLMASYNERLLKTPVEEPQAIEMIK